MKFFGILAVLFVLLYLLLNFADSTPSFEDDFSYIRIDDVRFTMQESNLVISNVSSDVLDQIKITYEILASTSEDIDRNKIFYQRPDTTLPPGDTITLVADGNYHHDGPQIHYRLTKIDYRVAPF